MSEYIWVAWDGETDDNIGASWSPNLLRLYINNLGYAWGGHWEEDDDGDWIRDYDHGYILLQKCLFIQDDAQLDKLKRGER